MFPKLTLIVGGSASGKSCWAEEFVQSAAKSKTYLATSRIHDTEMRAKIDLHVARRNASWALIEEPMDLTSALSDLQTRQICLIDCATMWLSNHLLADRNLVSAQSAFLGSLTTCAADLVVVSNEVGQGIVPDNPLARTFREAQGRLNIALAAQADLVVQIVVGLPIILKGQLP